LLPVLINISTLKPSNITTINMNNEKFALPVYWNDYEDIAQELYEKFGDDFNEAKIYRIRFTELLEWVLELPNFKGTREESNEGHLEQIQSAWVYEWRDNQD
jgi:FeS assembly protein IscX